MPTRCNRGFYYRSYCLLNMFRAPLCPSSGAQDYYRVVAACGISCCGFQVAGPVWSWGLCVRFAGYCVMQTGHITVRSTSDQQLENHRQQPLYNSLELLMMGIVVPETCWASNKICNKNLCCIQLAFYFQIIFTTRHEVTSQKTWIFTSMNVVETHKGLKNFLCILNISKVQCGQCTPRFI